MRRARAISVVLVLLLVVSACTSGTTTTTTSRLVVTTVVGESTATTVLDDPALKTPLPIDPDIRIGVLPNGLTYYLRHNESPGGRVELRLLVDVGSVQEDDDQSGGAHFLEHMMFNGTARFPRNELIAALESFGPRFGPDINAHTSFDETVYELSLAADPELVSLGINVLREWAAEATLTEDDVIGERGVVLDEWRLRAQGFSSRVSEAFQELILPGSAYENRLPIGTAEAIASTEPNELRRFYEDWYRPDRMAVVAVGDIDLDDVEAQITGAFDSLVSPDDPREWVTPTYEPPSNARAIRVVDTEATGASVSVVWPLASRSVETVGQFKDFVAASTALNILANRLREDALRGEAPLLGASAFNFNFGELIHLSGLDVETRPPDLEAGLRSLLIEVKRVEQFGFLQSEFDRAMTRLRANSAQLREQRDSIQDAAFTNQISAHFLTGSHLMSPEQRLDVDDQVLDTITKADLEAALVERFLGAPMVLTVGPEDQIDLTPDEATVLRTIEAVAGLTVDQRPERASDIETLMARPEPVAVVTQGVDSNFGYTTLTFENGATVYLWPSTIAQGAVFASAESFGGTSQVAIEDLPEAALITDIIGRSGVGPADVPALEDLLADRIVQVFPWMGETREGLTGGSAATDIETLFQLFHLYMTAPRVDDVAVNAVLDEIMSVSATASDIPGIVFDEALDEGYYGDDPRYFIIPTPEQLAEFDVDAAEAVYRGRFSNAGDFAFAFVGDFEVEYMIDLAARYIGTLPGNTDHEGFVDNQPLPARTIQLFEVQAGSDEQGQLGLFFTNPFEPTLKDRLTGELLQLIVNSRLRDRIREQLSATYSIQSGIDLQLDPDSFAEAFVLSSGHPDDLERISTEVIADLADLQANGPSAEQFATALEQLRTEMDLIDNQTIASALLTAYLYPDRPVTELAERFVLIDQIAAVDVRDFARIAFNLSQRIEVRLGPRP